MKRLFTFDDFMVALIAALGYGLGAEIPKLLEWHPWLCVGLSMVAGTVLDTRFAIDWKEFPQALIVSDKGIQCGPVEDKLTEIKALLDFVQSRG